jgi:hypothetical protein
LKKRVRVRKKLWLWWRARFYRGFGVFHRAKRWFFAGENVVVCVANVAFLQQVFWALKIRHVLNFIFQAGPLRAGRSLRDLCTPSVGAPVGRDEIFFADQREACGEVT